MVLNIPDAKLLRDALEYYTGFGHDGWDGYHNAEYQKLLDRLSHVADSKTYPIEELDATAWEYTDLERTLLVFHDDATHLRLELCDGLHPMEDEDAHECNMVWCTVVDVVTGEVTI